MGQINVTANSGLIEVLSLWVDLLRQKIFAVTLLREIKTSYGMYIVNRRDWCICYTCYTCYASKKLYLELLPKKSFDFLP